MGQPTKSKQGIKENNAAYKYQFSSAFIEQPTSHLIV